MLANGQKHASLFLLKMKHIGFGCNCFLNIDFQVVSLVGLKPMTSSSIPLLWEEEVQLSYYSQLLKSQ